MNYKIILVVLFGLAKNTAYSQNKKEQIEALNFSIDSLHGVIKTEKTISQVKSSEIENLKTQIEALNLKDKKSQLQIENASIEITQLHKDISKLKTELESAKICNQFMNYLSITNLADLNEIQSCAKASVLKADFYRHYYEVFLLKQLRQDFNLNDLSDVVVLDLLQIRRKDIGSSQVEESELLNAVNTLDKQFVLENYSKEKTSLSQTFSEMLKQFYFNTLSDEYYINVVDQFILTFYNLNGAGTEANVTQLYEVKNNIILPIDVYENILLNIESKMVKHFGKDNMISQDFTITKINGQYQVECKIRRADDPLCCGSGSIKFLTTDFITYDHNSLMWGNRTNGDVVNWKAY
jgi:hypothetical protein